MKNRQPTTVNRQPKIVIGLTGLIASGKTETAKAFKKAGFAVVDVDSFAHGLYTKGKPLYKALVKKYGPCILGANREIDRRGLAELAFAGKKQYLSFSRLVFPYLNRALKVFIDNRQPSTDNRQPIFIVLDMAVLFESGFYRNCDAIVFVSSRENHILARLRSRRPGATRKALKFQKLFPVNKKIALSDYIIYNNKNMAALRRAAGELMSKIEDKYGCH